MPKNKRLIYATAAAVFFSFASIIYDPFFTPLLLSKGFSKETISLVFSVAPFILIFFSSSLGSISDFWGRKKVLVFSLIFLILSLVLYLYIPKSIPLLIITSLLNVLAWQTYNDVSAERAEDNITNTSRGLKTGTYLSLIAIGSLAATSLGTIIAYYYSYELTFRVGIILLIILLFAGLFRKIPTKSYPEKTSFNIFTNLKRFWSIKKLRGLAIASITVNFGVYAAKSVFIPVFITKTLGQGVFFIGLFATAYSIPHLTQYYFGKKCDLHGSGRIIVLSIISYSLIVMSLAIAPGIYSVLFVGFMMGLTLGAWSTGALCYLSEIGERNKMEGTLVGTSASIAYFGIFLGYLSSGLLSSHIPIRLLFVIYGLVPLVGMMFAAKYLLAKEKVLITD